jgi:hypothetical protein
MGAVISVVLIESVDMECLLHPLDLPRLDRIPEKPDPLGIMADDGIFLDLALIVIAGRQFKVRMGEPVKSVLLREIDFVALQIGDALLKEAALAAEIHIDIKDAGIEIMAVLPAFAEIIEGGREFIMADIDLLKLRDVAMEEDIDVQIKEGMDGRWEAAKGIEPQEGIRRIDGIAVLAVGQRFLVKRAHIVKENLIGGVKTVGQAFEKKAVFLAESFFLPRFHREDVESDIPLGAAQHRQHRQINGRGIAAVRAK